MNPSSQPMWAVPTATYRLQLNHQFTLKQATALVEYLSELGISHIYCSPVTKAAPYSLHGYDVVDSRTLNPEIGSEDDFRVLSEKLRSKGMGLLLDIVPNHMHIGNALNSLWNDVLENGPSSPYSEFFDIDWLPPREQLENKVLLPLLDSQYGQALESQQVQIVFVDGVFNLHLRSSNIHLPLNPRSWSSLLGSAVKSLEDSLSKDDPYLLELQSIWTALNHLPRSQDTDPEKVAERLREKEIIKTRLAVLCQNSAAVRTELERTVQVLNGTQGDPRSFDALEEFLTHQPYRLCYWRVANDEINYRRFFDICELAGIRTEVPTVFQYVHELVLHLVSQGWVDGLRVDHVDGLYDPQEYLSNLQNACKHALQAGGFHSAAERDVYLVVEKILMNGEKLRTDWRVSGTVGYDFLNQVNGLFVQESNRAAFEESYQRFTHIHQSIWELLYASKLLTENVSMSSELNVLTRQLDRIKEQHRSSRDITRDGLRLALQSVIASFQVYRTYIAADKNSIHEEDRATILAAIDQAKGLNPAVSASIYDFIRSVLLLDPPPGLDEAQLATRRRFVMAFQQFTAPVAAIGVENTAFYRHYPLLSLNEVGSDLATFGLSVAAFHQRNQERVQCWPHALLTTSTHDTKASEDVRARIDVLSELPQEWDQLLWQWTDLNRAKKRVLEGGHEAPDRNEEYLFYQVLIGLWPLYPMDATAHAQFVDRVEQYMNKAIKEAKVHTSWISPNTQHEEGVRDFIREVLSISVENAFLESIKEFLPKVMRAGIYNSLSQLVLKMSSPGVPDFYQGSELWTLALVDPDNRRPVDYSNSQSLLAAMRTQEGNHEFIQTLVKTPEDGRIKIYLTSRGLRLRRDQPELFSDAAYIPLEVEGHRTKNAVAFCRVRDEKAVISVVGRYYTELLGSSSAPIGEIWKDSTVLLAKEVPQGVYRDVFTGNLVRALEVDGRIALPLDEVFAAAPVSLLERIPE